MARPHIEFVASVLAPPETVADGPFAGLPALVLSRDADDPRAQTLRVELPAGWQGTVAAEDRQTELLVLRGAIAIAIEGGRLDAGAYADVPPRATNAEIAVESASLVLVMTDETGSGSTQLGSPMRVVDTVRMDLHDSGVDGVPAGLVIKLLRADDVTGDWTWIAACPPGWVSNLAEVHPTVEEAFVLRGDILLGAPGEMGAGDYFWRPSNVWHGPMTTRAGHLTFMRTRGGTMEVTFDDDVTGWPELLADYRAREPFYLGD